MLGGCGGDSRRTATASDTAKQADAILESQPPAASDDAREIFPHVRLNARERYVEFDGTVPIRLDDREAPYVYLELIACTPNTREHEVLVVTRAKPSHVHAALLVLGLEPGAPAAWRVEGQRLVGVPPRGDAVEIELRYTKPDGTLVAQHPSEWIVRKGTSEHPPLGHWIFAGSAMMRREGKEVYAADGEGTMIGLASFGSEVLAYPEVISPESSIDAPVWVADPANVPAMDTRVVVRVRAVNP